MNEAHEMPGIDPRIDANAVSVYGQDAALDDFPVLKAFQQYVDAEQAKAHKRMMSLCIFFVLLMAGVISVFVVLLMNISQRNQELNDRLVEYAINNKSSQGAPVVVQPPQDSAAILALTAKMDEMQKKLAADQAKAEKAAQEAAEATRKAALEAAEAAKKAALEAAKPKEPTPEELEIKRLKALLEAEKDKKIKELERQRQREVELEEYRRKHYPELYEVKRPVRPSTKPVNKVRKPLSVEDVPDEDSDEIIDDSSAISYYDDEDADEGEPVKKTVPKPANKKPLPAKKAEAPSPEKEYSIPVDVKGSSIQWNVPKD